MQKSMQKQARWCSVRFHPYDTSAVGSARCCAHLHSEELEKFEESVAAFLLDQMLQVMCLIPGGGVAVLPAYVTYPSSKQIYNSLSDILRPSSKISVS